MEYYRDARGTVFRALDESNGDADGENVAGEMRLTDRPLFTSLENQIFELVTFVSYRDSLVTLVTEKSRRVSYFLNSENWL